MTNLHSLKSNIFPILSKKPIYKNVIGIILFIFTVILSIRLILFVKKFALNVLYADQWSLCTPLIEGKGVWDIFNFQLGPHRQGIGGIVTSMIYQITGWDIVAESMYISSLLIVNTFLLLFLKKKITDRFSIFDIVITVFCLSTAQYSTIINTPNSSHSIFPFLLLSLLGLLFASKNTIRKYIFISAVTFLIIFTGFGIFAGIPVCLILCCILIHELKQQKREIRIITTTILSILFVMSGYLLFFHDYKFCPAVACFQFPHSHPLEYLYFVLMMFTNIFQLFGKVYLIIGACIFMVVIFICINSFINMTRLPNPSFKILFLFTCFSILFCVSAAIGRVCLGLDAAQASRYITLVIPAIIAIYLYISMLRYQFARQVICVIFLLITLWCSLPLHDRYKKHIEYKYSGKKKFYTCYVNHFDVDCTDQISFYLMNKDKVDYLINNRLTCFKDFEKDFN